MGKYIEIINNKITLHEVDLPISPSVKTKPFSLDINDIAIIAWAVRMLFDDEEYFYILVD